jgi:hypothetical protein
MKFDAIPPIIGELANEWVLLKNQWPILGIIELDGCEHAIDWNVGGRDWSWLLRLREEAGSCGVDDMRHRIDDLPVFCGECLDSGGIRRDILPRPFFH